MRICVITATRAEYGLLYPLLKRFNEEDSIDVDIVVSGTHLLERYGNTKEEIYEDNLGHVFEIDIIGEYGNDACGISNIMAQAIHKFAEYLKYNRPDLAVILGDRYEMMAFAIPLLNEKIPIAHLNGGEVTGGLLDESYRHCITKMSTLHFTNCEAHRNRVIKMGENPHNVYNVGDICIDNIINTQLYSLSELEEKFKIDLRERQIILFTYHPVTVEDYSSIELQNLLQVISEFDDMYYIFTMSNADKDGERINSIIREYVAEHDNSLLVPSLGRRGYISMLKYAKAVIGNSSSGIYEAPYFGIPTINVGIRQKDRLHGMTVIDCDGDIKSIKEAIKYAFSPEFIRACKKETNIWGDGTTADKIVQIILKRWSEGIEVRKSFYDGLE